MSQIFKLDGVVLVNDKATSGDIEEMAAGLAVDTFELVKDYAADLKVGGPEFQALLHTPCREYQA